MSYRVEVCIRLIWNKAVFASLGLSGHQWAAALTLGCPYSTLSTGGALFTCSSPAASNILGPPLLITQLIWQCTLLLNDAPEHNLRKLPGTDRPRQSFWLILTSPIQLLSTANDPPSWQDTSRLREQHPRHLSTTARLALVFSPSLYSAVSPLFLSMSYPPPPSRVCVILWRFFPAGRLISYLPPRSVWKTSWHPSVPVLTTLTFHLLLSFSFFSFFFFV